MLPPPHPHGFMTTISPEVLTAPMIRPHAPARIAATGLALLIATGCATGPGTGRLDRIPDVPHLARYRSPEAAQEPTLLHAVSITPLLDDAFDMSGRQQVLTALAQAMSDHLGVATDAVPSASALDAPGGPVLYIGSAEGPLAPAGAEEVRADHEEYAPMVAHLQYPSEAWSLDVSRELASTGAGSVVMLWVGFSHYPKADRGLFGKKVVLGTGHEEDIPFLSAVDEPVEVLQLTGVVVDGAGRVVRAGAEGIIHRETPFWAQVLGLRRELTDTEVARILEGPRREDLPGRPLAWQAALDALLASLVPGGHARPALAPTGPR